MRVLVTGVTGYVGGRLVPVLLEQGHQVRVLTRSMERIAERPWTDQVTVVEGDASDSTTLDRALRGTDIAYYLIHSLGQAGSFELRDRTLARGFASAAERAGITQLVYLGGIAPSGDDLSPHLRSRVQVGRILLASTVPALVLQAAVIIGSGSISFEMLRYLTERLPAMVAPRWVRSRIQPIAIRDVMWYLSRVATLPEPVNRGVDIGGPDVLTYQQMMQRFARISGLPRRVILPVPVLTPSLSSHWVGLVTPVPAGIAKPLVGSLRHEVICTVGDAVSLLGTPEGGLTGFDDAVRLALRRIQQADVSTRWSSAATPGAPSDPLPTDPNWAGGSLYVDQRNVPVRASPDVLWAVLEGIGGDRGWYSARLPWRLRGILDRLVGGVGLRRGRRDADRLYVGDALDWWRVEAREPGRLLRLRAEMRLPGLAWLELRIDRTDGGVRYDQRALFHPHGLLGQLYWWAIRPFHGLVFGQMVRNVARAAESVEHEAPASGTSPIASASDRPSAVRQGKTDENADDPDRNH